MSVITTDFPEYRMIKVNQPGYNEEGQHSQIYDTLIFGYYGNNMDGKDAEYKKFVGSIERGSIQFYMADGENIRNFVDALKTLNPERYGKIELFDNGEIGIRCSDSKQDCAVSGGRRKRSSKKRKGSIKLLKKKRVKTNKRK
jgi:hypothetical protein